ncbi:MAG TPA: AAA family ATPase [Dermatophilaceae bacterium]|nr:AAA family ATPase [Dermatophilaceae bacterium]
MLVGRADERGRLRRLLAGARAGAGAAVVVVGEAGMGKTALLASVVDGVGDMFVLRATGTRAEHDLPFAGLSALVRPVLGLLDEIPAPQADALGAALALRPGHAGDRFAVGAAALSLVCRAAEERPVVAVVDDLHLLDRPSLDAVLFLGRRLVTDAVALLLATRPEAGVDDLVADLDQLVLPGLDERAARELVGDPRVTDAALHRLLALTGGNPLALLEMGAHALPPQPDVGGLPVPRLIVAAFAARVERLFEPARSALLVATVAGDSDLPTVAAACAAQGVAVSALEEAERDGLVAVGPHGVAFRHQLLRAAVYQAAEPAARRAAHRAMAAALPDTEVDRRTWHLERAAVGADPVVAGLLRATAESARSRGGYAVAAAGFERAADLSVDAADRARLLTAAGESAWLAGLTDLAVGCLARAVRRAPDADTRWRAMALQGLVSARRGSLTEARDLLLAAADAATASTADVDEVVLVLAEAVYTCFYLADGPGTERALERLDAVVGRSRAARARVVGALAGGMGRVLVGRGVEGVTLVRRAVHDMDRGEMSTDPRWLPWLLLGPIWLREAGEARGLLEGVVDEARARAAVGTLPFLLFHAARDDATTDRWQAAEAGFREAVDLAAESGQRTDEGISLAGLTWLVARQGRQEQTREVAARALASCAASRLEFGRLWVEYALGDLEAGAGRPERATSHYRAVQATTRRCGVDDPDLSPRAELVECLVALEQHAAAADEARAALAEAAAKGQPWALARAHRALAITGEHPERHFAAAMGLHDRLADAYERARTELAHGTWLRRVHRPGDARAPLRSALVAFDRLGAAPWAEAASRELAATGERVQRRQAGGQQPLTGQELQVVRLLVRGRTTREAAAALFLSPKTVEYHLRHVYIKLGISSRTELADRFPDLTDP